jgi:hypothetical protein
MMRVRKLLASHSGTVFASAFPADGAKRSGSDVPLTRIPLGRDLACFTGEPAWLLRLASQTLG